MGGVNGEMLKSKSSRPNILWIMTDEHRTDSLGCYGSTWAKTPNLDRLAKEGVAFNNAVTPSPLCVSARLSILTGKYPSELGVWNNKQSKKEEDHLTYYFKNEGYTTASFGKQHYQTDKKAFDTEVTFDLGDEVGYFEYDKKYDENKFDVIKYRGKMPWIMGGIFPAYVTETQENRVVELAKSFLQNKEKDTPFLLRLSFNGPHTPVVTPKPFDTVIDKDSIKIPAESIGVRKAVPQWIKALMDYYASSDIMGKEVYERTRRFYYGYVSYIDYEIGCFLGWMKKRGFLDNTLIVFVSDHGTHVEDYGLVQKQTFYDPVVNVPFIIWYPERFKAGIKVDTPVEIRWLLPTLMNVAGIEVPERTNCNILTECLCTGQEPERKLVHSEFILNSVPGLSEDKIFMVRDGQWKLTAQYSKDQKLVDAFLHNMDKDPYEQNNLYGFSEYNDISNRLMIEVQKHLHNNIQ